MHNIGPGFTANLQNANVLFQPIPSDLFVNFCLIFVNNL